MAFNTSTISYQTTSADFSSWPGGSYPIVSLEITRDYQKAGASTKCTIEASFVPALPNGTFSFLIRKFFLPYWAENITNIAVQPLSNGYLTLSSIVSTGWVFLAVISNPAAATPYTEALVSGTVSGTAISVPTIWPIRLVKIGKSVTAYLDECGMPPDPAVPGTAVLGTLTLSFTVPVAFRPHPELTTSGGAWGSGAIGIGGVFSPVILKADYQEDDIWNVSFTKTNVGTVAYTWNQASFQFPHMSFNYPTYWPIA